MKVLEYMVGSSLSENREEEKFFSLVRKNKCLSVDPEHCQTCFSSFILPFEKIFTNINTGQ